MAARYSKNAAVLDGKHISQRTDFNLSYHAGLFYTYKLFGPVSLRPALLYSVQGSSFESAKENFRTMLGYLQLPLLANAKIGSLHLQAGPLFGVLLNARHEGTIFTGYSATGAEEFANVSKQVADEFERQDFALCAGAEYNLVGGLRLGGRFVAGLNDVAKHQDVRSANDPRLKNRAFQLYAAFQLGKEALPEKHPSRHQAAHTAAAQFPAGTAGCRSCCCGRRRAGAQAGRRA